MTDRVPPHDLVAEQSVLGGMMLSKDASFDAIEVLRSVDFYAPKHGIIFEAILRLASHREPTDAVAVGDELMKRGELERAGGAEYLHSLTSIVPTAANAGYYAEIVSDRAVVRRLADAATRIAEASYSGEGEPADMVEWARGLVDGVVPEETHGTAMSVGEAFSYWVESIEGPSAGVETPWKELNGLITGFHPGRLYVIGARPGEGKSIMALQSAARLARTGPVAFASLEMSRNELMTRLVAMATRIHLTTLAERRLGAEQWSKISAARHEIEALPLVIDDRSEVTITAIQSFARTVSRRGHLAGVVVDYLQLVSGSKSKDRHEVVAEISRQLKIMAGDLRCPVIALSQLNRGVFGTQGKRRPPTLSDLRESGAIEQDADVVLLLDRLLESDGQPGDQLNVYVAKNRHGNTGMKSLQWEGKYSRVVSPVWGMPPELPLPE